jgi:hypothetical protein
MSPLNEYFQVRESACDALDRYLIFADERDWDIEGQFGKLHLYKLAADAFDKTTPYSEALISFRLVYEQVQDWPGVKRGGSFATAEDVFDIMLQDSSRFLFDTDISLANLTYPSLQTRRLNVFLPVLKFVKSTKQYPWMAVSKVLHFANPGLFPMWDWDVIWGKVMGKDQSGRSASFHSEYQAFCCEHKFSVWENGPEFVLYYTLWAASYIMGRHSEFMHWFVDWMNLHFSTDIAKYGLAARLPSYYATAFEFVAIGAAHLEA